MILSELEVVYAIWSFPLVFACFCCFFYDCGE